MQNVWISLMRQRTVATNFGLFRLQVLAFVWTLTDLLPPTFSVQSDPKRLSSSWHLKPHTLLNVDFFSGKTPLWLDTSDKGCFVWRAIAMNPPYFQGSIFLFEIGNNVTDEIFRQLTFDLLSPIRFNDDDLHRPRVHAVWCEYKPKWWQTLLQTQAQHLRFLHESIWFIWFHTLICLSNLSCEMWNRKLKVNGIFF